MWPVERPRLFTQRPGRHGAMCGSAPRRRCTSSWSTVMRAPWKRCRGWDSRSTSSGCILSRSLWPSTSSTSMASFTVTLKVILTLPRPRARQPCPAQGGCPPFSRKTQLSFEYSHVKSPAWGNCTGHTSPSRSTQLRSFCSALRLATSVPRNEICCSVGLP